MLRNGNWQKFHLNLNNRLPEPPQGGLIISTKEVQFK